MISGKRVKKRYLVFFITSLIIIAALYAVSVIKTESYNRTRHYETFAEDELFGEGASGEKALSVKAAPRSSTWSKAFDINNEGIRVNSLTRGYLIRSCV